MYQSRGFIIISLIVQLTFPYLADVYLELAISTLFFQKGGVKILAFIVSCKNIILHYFVIVSYLKIKKNAFLFLALNKKNSGIKALYMFNR